MVWRNFGFLGFNSIFFLSLVIIRSIDVIITRLRKKIEIDPKNPKYLQTIRGAGYVLWIE